MDCQLICRFSKCQDNLSKYLYRVVKIGFDKPQSDTLNHRVTVQISKLWTVNVGDVNSTESFLVLETNGNKTLFLGKEVQFDDLPACLSQKFSL